PAPGMRTPTISNIQMTDPKVMAARKICLSRGTRPNSRTLAQPRLMVSSLPANRPMTPNRVAKIAISDPAPHASEAQDQDRQAEHPRHDQPETARVVEEVELEIHAHHTCQHHRRQED